LAHGIPSHDTFGAVFAAIDNVHFSDCFSHWVADWATLTDGEVIAIDGKCLRRSLDKASPKAAIYMVSAWAHPNSLVLGQVKVDDKSNEITAIPKRLKRLDITGAVVTIDAMGCQKKSAEQIIRQGGHYVLSLKGNQGNLLDDVDIFFRSTLAPPATGVSIDGDHGRIETRAIQAADNIDWLRERHDWVELNSLIAVTAERESDHKTTVETRYFSSSLDAGDPKRLARVVRARWSIENSLHWVLDVAFGEDGNRTRKGHSADHLAVIRHIALKLIKNEESRKVGIKVGSRQGGIMTICYGLWGNLSAIALYLTALPLLSRIKLT
jgi:predicted transposase YbfD/YdcC